MTWYEVFGIVAIFALALGSLLLIIFQAPIFNNPTVDPAMTAFESPNDNNGTGWRIHMRTHYMDIEEYGELYESPVICFKNPAVD